MTGPREENQECGIRHRFKVLHRDRTPNRYPQQTERLLHWCRIFDEEGLAPVAGGASAGNLSFRTPNGFVITPSRTRLKPAKSASLPRASRRGWRAGTDHNIRLVIATRLVIANSSIS